ncbi:CD225/dispanin family protein [Hymenobacter guriensis]|uniref:CD225/dispanin family protein n=1 Tax=Hymenobacter guriensis TaxID=2793065 RepID=A0ABS0L4Z2_9BACT|nr:CD225/dispanin family protein [Hymenobacter guriensis]MBG8555162.1 CD225/dispanin family protein [Hymenobacter guriensis]
MEQHPYLSPQNSSGRPPKNWLIESILVTVFCFLPCGLLGVINATEVNSRWAAGDYEGARSAADKAARWTKIGFFIWLIISAVGLAFFLYVLTQNESFRLLLNPQ